MRINESSGMLCDEKQTLTEHRVLPGFGGGSSVPLAWTRVGAVGI